jgi:hypothetical protein
MTMLFLLLCLLPTITVFDPNAVIYAGPAALPGEPQIPWPDEPGVVIRPDGVEYTFTDLGVQKTHQCPDGNRWYFVEPTVIDGCVVEIPMGNCAEPEDAWTPSPDDASPPLVDPDFDEHSPTGPGPGPPGATTVDKP